MRFLLAFAQGGVLSPLLPLLRRPSTSATGTRIAHLHVWPKPCSDGHHGRLSAQLDPYVQLLLLGIMITGLGSLLCALAPGFYWLVGARVLVGLGISITTLAGLTVIIESTPPTAQGRANNLLEFSAIGSAVSPTLSGLMASLIHWRAAHLPWELVFVVGAFAWVIFTRQALEEDTRALTRKSASDNGTTLTRPRPQTRREPTRHK